jgi:hypothetical protein
MKEMTMFSKMLNMIPEQRKETIKECIGKLEDVAKGYGNDGIFSIVFMAFNLVSNVELKEVKASELLRQVTEGEDPIEKWLDDIGVGESEEGLLSVDDHDNALVGVSHGSFGDSDRLIYSRDTIIQNLIYSGMDFQQAQEYYDFNVAGAYMGKGSPLFISIYPGFVNRILDVFLNFDKKNENSSRQSYYRNVRYYRGRWEDCSLKSFWKGGLRCFPFVSGL